MVTTGVLIVLLGGLLQGSFAIFLKQRRSWEWENFWLVYSFIALLIFPILWMYASVPHAREVLTSLTPSLVFWPMFLGGLWGIGSILFGLAVERIGMALSFTIVVGLSSLIGSIVPLFLNKSLPPAETLLVLAIGLAVILAGVVVSGYAGFLREKSQNLKQSGYRAYVYGLLMAIFSGLLSSMNNIGFAYGSDIGEVAVKFGASSAVATLPIMGAVLFGGFWVNAGYAAFLLLKNQRLGKFISGGMKPFFGAIVAGLFWFGGIGLYGIATAYLGNLGTSVGYAIFVSSVIVVSNLWGIITQEWTGTRKALSIQVLSFFVIIAGVAIISFSL